MTRIMRGSVKCSRCGNESTQLFVFSANFSQGSKDINESLANHRQVCPYCGYEAISLDYNHIQYQFTEIASEPKTSEWTSRVWKIYGNLSLQLEEIYPSGNNVIKKCFISSSDLKEIDKNIEISRMIGNYGVEEKNNKWEIIKYECGREKWKRAADYICGISTLEAVTKLLYDLVFNSNYIVEPEEKFTTDLNNKEVKISNESKIQVNVNNDKSSFQISLSRDNENKCKLSFSKTSDINNKSVDILEIEYIEFELKIKELLLNWNKEYEGDKNLSWNIAIDNNSVCSGKGGYPSNWNSFVDLLIKYERLYKSKAIA